MKRVGWISAGILGAVVLGSLVVGSAATLNVQPAKMSELTRPDAYPPRVTTLEMRDADTDGRVDQVIATFSEALAAYTAGTAPWTLANVPSGGTLASVSVSGSQATLTITEGAGAANTAVGTFSIALAASAAGIRDASDNQASFAATAPADKAGPVPTSVGTQNNGGNKNVGLIQSGDTFYAVFSESILVSSVPATTTVTMADPVGAVAIDTLSIPGITNGTLSAGGTGYVATDGAQASFVGSTPGVYLGTTVYVTVGPTCAGGCGALGKGTGTFVYTPATTLTDAAGNPAAGTASTAVALF